MATVASMASSGSATATANAMNTSTATNTSAIEKKIEQLKKQLQELNADTSIDTKTKAEQQKDINKQIEKLNQQLAQAKMDAADEEVASTTNNTFSSLNSSSGSGDTFSTSATGADFFFGTKATLSNMQAMNKARMGIENEARTLTSQIQTDKARGVDTSEKEGRLSNLTSNLTILDENLGKNISDALKEDEGDDEEKLSVIDKIKKSLEESKKAAQKLYGTTDADTASTTAADKTDGEKTAATDSSNSTASTASSASDKSDGESK